MFLSAIHASVIEARKLFHNFSKNVEKKHVILNQQ